MLKRNGERRVNDAPETLNRDERDAYDEAFEAIRKELEALERIKMAVKTMIENPIPANGSQRDSFFEVQNAPIDRWKIPSTLLKLRNSQICLCERSVQGAKEVAIIERFQSDSAYARANGDAEVLSTAPIPCLTNSRCRYRQLVASKTRSKSSSHGGAEIRVKRGEISSKLWGMLSKRIRYPASPYFHAALASRSLVPCIRTVQRIEAEKLMRCSGRCFG